MLYGMDFQPARRKAVRRSEDLRTADQFFQESASLTRKMLAALPSNRDLINQVKLHGLQKI